MALGSKIFEKEISVGDSFKVDGDVAVLHFYGYWRLPGDEAEVEEWRRTEVWRMDGGRWKQWAGHATPTG